jgi:hypothetical protein
MKPLPPLFQRHVAVDRGPQAHLLPLSERASKVAESALTGLA